VSAAISIGSGISIERRGDLGGCIGKASVKILARYDALPLVAYINKYKIPPRV